jgi:hypothetical protein
VCRDVQLVALIGDRLRTFIPESSVIAAATTTSSHTIHSSQQHSMLSGSSISCCGTASTSAAQHTASVSSVHTVSSGVKGSVSNPFKHTAVLAGLAMSVLAVAIESDSDCQQALLQRYLRYNTIYTILVYIF